MNTFSQVPPGFRFHPTDEELVDYYLRRKVTSRRIDVDVIKEVDLYKIEPWDLQELCRIGTEEQNDWYFFSHKDKKYPTGTRTNRATTAGFWKATGRDKAIYSKHDLIGMRKTLVFYKGRAPNGQKSDWIMHEYRLETDENGTPQEEGWVVCRVFKKRIATTMRKTSEHDSPTWYDDHQVSFMPDIDSPPKQQQQQQHHHNNLPYNLAYTTSCKKEMDLQQYGTLAPDNTHFLQHLPLLESPKLLQQQPQSQIMPSYTALKLTNLQSASIQDHNMLNQAMLDQNFQDQVTDWRVLDKFVASQLSQDNEEAFQDKVANNNAPASSSIDLWK